MKLKELNEAIATACNVRPQVVTAVQAETFRQLRASRAGEDQRPARRTDDSHRHVQSAVAVAVAVALARGRAFSSRGCGLAVANRTTPSPRLAEQSKTVR